MIDRLSIHGPALASLLHSCYTGQRMCDGVLFGTIQQNTTTQAHDDAEAMETLETVAHISGAICCCSTCSFYDAVGSVDGAKLADITTGAPGQPIGWFSHRPGTPQHPSLRETLVTASLQHWLAQQQHSRDSSTGSSASGSTSRVASHEHARHGQSGAGRLPPVVFGIIGSGEEHGGATISLQYRMFQPAAAPTAALSSSDGPSSSGVSLQPLQLETLNLGRSLGRHAGGSSSGAGGSTSSSACGFEGAAFAAALGAGPAHEAQQLQRQLAAAAAAQQVGVMEGVYALMLRRLEGLAGEVGEQKAEVDVLRQKQEGLLAGLQD